MSFFELLWAYALVFLLSAIPFFEAYATIPLGIIAGLSVIPALVIGLAGNILTVILLIIFINKIKDWRKKRKNETEENQPSKRSLRAQKLWKKYGLPGLAMIGPLFVGSHLTAFMSVTLGGTKKRTVYWMITSITIWSLLFSILAHFGIDLFGDRDHSFLEDFMNR
ncbi:small multi-drug export protein [Anaerobacillus sp. CMMVII]|uniref:small multi-drug export protein n=1 Tax=Anaerobacillus sp. CMMVII TaxID=2755588 RepID=UPI0021B78B51|nr:small multi-drug export protein [Anaerobacillus sp. CMMVII]MCT8136736.1 small multi-drug export protein [Anaerobacillus sp. CMMVII]